ncbi:hypothetical protein AB0B01_10925 [Streptomyces sp. NPDC044571]|uniref:hypothetical protein n=1 Tax=Streptomyces sp. NPDC044571 TaxID=3155371 RepID=UPI003402D5B3
MKGTNGMNSFNRMNRMNGTHTFRIPRRRPAAAVALASAALVAALLPSLGQPPDTSPRSGSAPRTATCRDGTGAAACSLYGPAAGLGNGTIRAYSAYEGGKPEELGISLTASALTGLPTSPTDGKHCFDADADGSRDPVHECVGGHSRELALPAAPPASTGPALPFQWALFNWNPYGHNPHGRYDVPHFDVHFYLVPQQVRAGIRTGSCALLIACDQLAAAAKPVPDAYLPAGYPASSPQTAEGAMGAHLDSRPPTTGTLSGQTLIYGAYAGELVFIEPMLTKAFLERQRTAAGHRTCEPVPQPAAWRTPGWYPTRYCTAYRPDQGDYTVSLTDFVPSAGVRPLVAAGR